MFSPITGDIYAEAGHTLPETTPPNLHRPESALRFIIPISILQCQNRVGPMTRKSIEATAKYFLWGIFVLFLFVLFKVLQMMGFFV